MQTAQGLRYIAHGKDPYFPSWCDTAQLNYSNLELHDAMQDQLLRVVQWCDGVRCDMAMLCLSDIFGRTWSETGPLGTASRVLARGLAGSAGALS